MTTWLDHSRAGVVIGCHRCPSYREHRPTTAEAWAEARAHAAAVHGPRSAEARHAEKNLHRRVAGRTPGEDDQS